MGITIKRVLRSFLTFSMVACLLFLPLNTISGFVSSSEDPIGDFFSPADYVYHPPIIITSNDHFGEGYYNFPGTGTAADPYRIEGYNFSACGGGIYIGGTDVHFVISDCWIYTCLLSYKYAIQIDDVAEGTARIFSNILVDNYKTIIISNSSSVYIANNTITKNTIGIYISDSNHTTITANTIDKNSAYGIQLKNSHHGTIIENTIKKNGQDGIYAESSSGLNILSNNISNGYGNGLTVKDDVFIKGNIIANNSNKGITIEGSSNVMTENWLENNDFLGVELSLASTDNIVYLNNFINNNYGAEQAFDDGENNVWYNDSLKMGNYWGEGTADTPYEINGKARSTDLYPLENVFLGEEHTAETGSFSALWVLSLLFVGYAYTRRKKRMK